MFEGVNLLNHVFEPLGIVHLQFEYYQTWSWMSLLTCLF